MEEDRRGYEKVPSCDVEQKNSVLVPVKRLRITEKGIEGCCVGILIFVFIFNLFASLIAWTVALEDYYRAKGACNFRVDALVVNQTVSTFFGKCDLTLQWTDALHEKRYTLLQKRECDPEARVDTRFPEPTCYKKGEADLRVGVGYEIYPVSKIPSLKKTWIVFLVVWMFSAVPFALLIVSMVVSISYNQCCENGYLTYS